MEMEKVLKLNKYILINILQKLTNKKRLEFQAMNRRYNNELMYEVSPSWKWKDQFVEFDNNDFVGMVIASDKLIGGKALVGFMSFSQLLNFVLKTGVKHPNYAYFRSVYINLIFYQRFLQVITRWSKLRLIKWNRSKQSTKQ